MIVPGSSAFCICHVALCILPPRAAITSFFFNFRPTTATGIFEPFIFGDYFSSSEAPEMCGLEIRTIYFEVLSFLIFEAGFM